MCTAASPSPPLRSVDLSSLLLRPAHAFGYLINRLRGRSMMNRVRALPVAWTKTGRVSWCTSVPSREPPTSTRPSLRPYACPSLHMSKSKQQPVGVSLVAGVIAGAVEGLATYPTVRHTLDRTKRALVSYVAIAMKLELKRTLHPFTTGLCQNPSPVRIFNSRSKGSPATCS